MPAENREISFASENAQGGTKKAKEKTQLTNLQKAAMLMIAVEVNTAAEILKHLREDEIEAITFEIARIKYITPEDKEEVILEFNKLMASQEYILTGGIEYARELLDHALGTRKSIDIINFLASSLRTKPFSFIRKSDPQNLLNFIQNEQPQTIALILCYLSPQNAAYILSRLASPKVQTDVAERIANMERISPEALTEAEQVLERKMSTLASEEYTTTGGVTTLAEVLNLVDRSTEKSIMGTLEEKSPDLAEQVKKQMLVFEDIVLLSDQAVRKVIREVDSETITKALKSVDASIQAKIFSNVSKRNAAYMKQDLEMMGPVRLSDVEDCQQKIVDAVRRLEESGSIIVARGQDYYELIN